MRGPYPIFCRGHSGGRLVCEAFIRNGIEMGRVAPLRKDTTFFGVGNPPVREAVLHAFDYLRDDGRRKAYYQDLMRKCVETYRRQECAPGRPFGWKLGISLFTMPMVLDAFPSARVVHLIRDGRDVMLSRLEARFGDLADPVNRLAVFGDSAVSNYRNQPLDAAVVEAHRNELELLHWVTAVSYGLEGRQYGERYLEVRYEDICDDPIREFARIFEFLDVPFLADTQAWLRGAVTRTRIGKWKALPERELQTALQLGGELLRKLRYL